MQILGLLSLALLTFSCSNDDYEIQDAKSSDLKDLSIESLKKELNETRKDSIGVYRTNGEPNNPKPPR